MTSLGKAIRILILEDSDFDAELVVRELRKGGLEFVWQRARTEAEYCQALQSYRPDTILVDYKLPGFDGARAIVLAKDICPDVPAIVVTGAVGEDTAVELFKKGATDFVLKDRIAGRLVGTVERAIKEAANRVVRRQAEEQQQQLNEEMRRLATSDPLTGVASRPLLVEKLVEAIAEIDPLEPRGVLFSIQLDHFKQVNATYGASFADQVLVETARRLDSLCGTRDLVAHVEGDHFFLLLRRDAIENQLPEIRKGIANCFDRPFHLRNINVTVDASVGGVVLKAPGDTTADLFAQCEETVRRIKKGEHPGGILVADAGIIAKVKRQSTLDEEIRQGVQAGDLFSLFQPIVSLETGRVHGAEALLRFRRKDGSILPAADFMDAVIRTASLALIDETIISRFLRTDRELIAPLLGRKDFRFSFNVAPGILSNPKYAEEVLAQIAAGGAAPGSFTLEILEEGLMPSDGAVAKNLAALRQAGIRLAIDDFGIGYSNLLRLSRLPVDELKIPRELVASITSDNARLKAVLATVVDIAKNLGLLIVAEGVEEQAEADHLRRLDCEYGQGYLFGKAMPLGELAGLVESR